MTTATEDRTEVLEGLEGLRARREELGRELTEAKAELRTARDRLIEGAGDREAVMKGQLKANSLEEATRELDSRIEALEAEGARADRAEAHEVRLMALVELDAEMREAWAGIEAERQALADRLSAGAGRIADLRAKIGELKAEFLRGAVREAPAFESRGGGDAGAVEIERAYALASALRSRGVTFEVLQTDLPAAGRPVRPNVVTVAHALAADHGELGQLVDRAVSAEEERREREKAQRERQEARRGAATGRGLRG